jgi:hypothetical protein
MARRPVGRQDNELASGAEFLDERLNETARDAGMVDQADDRGFDHVSGQGIEPGEKRGEHAALPVAIDDDFAGAEADALLNLFRVGAQNHAHQANLRVLQRGQQVLEKSLARPRQQGLVFAHARKPRRGGFRRYVP